MPPSPPTCIICYDPLQGVEDVFEPKGYAVVLLCGHSFHAKCIETSHSHQHASFTRQFEPPYHPYTIYRCPTCRSPSCLSPVPPSTETFPYYIKLYLETTSTSLLGPDLLAHLTPEARGLMRLLEKAREVRDGVEEGERYVPRDEVERAFLDPKAWEGERVQGLVGVRERVEVFVGGVMGRRMEAAFNQELRNITKSIKSLTAHLDLTRQLSVQQTALTSLLNRYKTLQDEHAAAQRGSWSREKELRLEWVENRLELRESELQTMRRREGRWEERAREDLEKARGEIGVRATERDMAREQLRVFKTEYNSMKTDYEALKVRGGLDRAKAEKAHDEMTNMKSHLSRERANAREQRALIVELKRKVIVATKKASSTPTPQRHPIRRNRDLTISTNPFSPSPIETFRGHRGSIDGLPGHRRANSEATGLRRFMAWGRAQDEDEEEEEGVEGEMDPEMTGLGELSFVMEEMEMQSTPMRRAYGGHVDVGRVLAALDSQAPETPSKHTDTQNKSNILLPSSISNFSFGSFDVSGSHIMHTKPPSDGGLLDSPDPDSMRPFFTSPRSQMSMASFFTPGLHVHDESPLRMTSPRYLSSPEFGHLRRFSTSEYVDGDLGFLAAEFRTQGVGRRSGSGGLRASRSERSVGSGRGGLRD